MDDEGNPLSEEDAQAIAQTKAFLGGDPRSCLWIGLSRVKGTQQVAVRFAATIAKRWPCVVDDVYGRLFSTEDILRLEQEGGHFTEYGL